MRQFIQFLCLTLFLFGCGGSSSGRQTVRVDFNGDWLVTFNIIVDECGLVEEDVFAFEDEHSIIVSDGSVQLTSVQLLLEAYSGNVRDQGSFEVSNVLDGDIFSDGSICNLSEEISYEGQSENEATGIYTLKLSCSDGFSCASSARGLATRL